MIKNVLSEEIEINGVKILIKSSRGKKLRLTISPKTLAANLHIPQGYSKVRAMQFVKQNLDWIKKNQIKLAEKNSKHDEARSLNDGDTIFLWGIEYIVKIVQGGKNWRYTIDYNFFYIHEPKNTKQADVEQKKILVLDRLYKKELQIYIEEILEGWKTTVSENNFTLKYRDMKTKWGSCNITNRIITLNTRLAEKEEIFAELVLVHELVHFKERLHNSQFKFYMTKFLPDWKRREKILRNLQK